MRLLGRLRTQALTGYPNSDAYSEAPVDISVSTFTASGAGGNFEQLTPINSSTPVTIADTITPTTITLSDVNGAEGTSHTITATVDHVVTGNDLVITLSNGKEITIAVGATSGTSAAFAL